LKTHWQSLTGDLKEAIHQAFSTQYPILKQIPISWYESRIVIPAFAETIRLSNELSDFDIEKLINALKIHDPDDWELYEYAVNLYEGV